MNQGSAGVSLLDRLSEKFLWGVWSKEQGGFLVITEAGSVFATKCRGYAEAQRVAILGIWPDARVREFGEWWEQVEEVEAARKREIDDNARNLYMDMTRKKVLEL